MSTLLAILMHNQARYAVRVADAVRGQSVQPDSVVVMLDRPDVDDIVAVRSAFLGMPGIRTVNVLDDDGYLGRPQMNPSVEQFCAGAMRNRVIRMAIDGNYDSVIFIDGDCVPSPDLVKCHSEALSASRPLVTVGRRAEVKHVFRDQRETDELLIPIFGDENAEVTEEAYFVDSGVVWTCNVGLNMAAIRSLMSLNKALFGRDEVFSSDFAGTWGGEDGYLGLQCFYTGISVVTLGSRESGVLHIEHSRPLAKYDHSTFLVYLETKRIELLHMLDLVGNNVRGVSIRGSADIIGGRPWRKKHGS